MLTTTNIHTDADTPFEVGRMETTPGFYLAIGRPGERCNIFLPVGRVAVLHAATTGLLEMVTGRTPGRPGDAIEQLTMHQRQLDETGEFVGVSRQALDEVLAYVAAGAQP